MFTIIDVVWPDGNDSNVELSELNFVIGSKPTADIFIKKIDQYPALPLFDSKRLS